MSVKKAAVDPNSISIKSMAMIFRTAEIDKRAKELSSELLFRKDIKISKLEEEVVFAYEHSVKNLLNYLSPLKRFVDY